MYFEKEKKFFRKFQKLTLRDRLVCCVNSRALILTIFIKLWKVETNSNLFHQKPRFINNASVFFQNFAGFLTLTLIRSQSNKPIALNYLMFRYYTIEMTAIVKIEVARKLKQGVYKIYKKIEKNQLPRSRSVSIHLSKITKFPCGAATCLLIFLYV